MQIKQGWPVVFSPFSRSSLDKIVVDLIPPRQNIFKNQIYLPPFESNRAQK